MGIFDIFKKKKHNKEEPDIEQINNPSDEAIYDLAYASMKYKEVQKNYKLYKKELINVGFADSKIVHNTIGLILQFYYASEKTDALNLYKEIDSDYPNNEDVTWLFIEVICTINIENDQEFVTKYLNLKRQQHDFDHHYQTEYQKGLELKSKWYYKEAIELWKSLNKIQEFSWNYYQIGILQNLMRDENCINNLRKGIEMDEAVKEDAKSYYELDNLRTTQEFLKLLE